MTTKPGHLPSAFLPPTNKSMRELDRAFFRKTVPLAAARVKDFKAIASTRTVLITSKELLQVNGIKPLVHDPEHPEQKSFLLHPQVIAQDTSTWSQQLRHLSDDGQVEVQPFNLQLTYDIWSMQDILDAILPEMPDSDTETPAGFAQAGHVAHLNLRNQYLPYKYLIGQVLVDKNPTIRTAINKTLDVGTESAFRTFPYEVLAGPDDMNVAVNEAGCEFKFNFGEVYWNSRLGTEHERLVAKFQEGEAVCDVMAGVGPFAIPAGKNRVFVHANDLNPASFEALKYAIERNKVTYFVEAHCQDGQEFIRHACRLLQRHPRTFRWQPKQKISRNASAQQRNQIVPQEKVYVEPATFDHFVMNLPATAVEMLGAFRGLYQGREVEFLPSGPRILPLLHVYLFQATKELDQEEHREICERLSSQIGAPIKVGDQSSSLELFHVRNVSPKKKMYCASFRLPPTVAFASSEPTSLVD